MTTILGYTSFSGGGNTTTRKNTNSADMTSATTIWDPTSGYKFVITGFIISTDTATNVKLSDDVTDILGPFYFPANGGVVAMSVPPIVSATADNILKATAGDAGNVTVTVVGYEVK